MYIALKRTDYKYILSFHNTDSPWCIARTRFYHLYKRGRVMIFYATLKGMVGKFHSHCRDGSPHFQTHISNSHPPPSPLLLSDKSLTPVFAFFPQYEAWSRAKMSHFLLQKCSTP